MALDVGAPTGAVLVRAGVFNATDVRDAVGNDGRILVAGRVVGRSPAEAAGRPSGLRLPLGANAAYEPSRQLAPDPSIAFPSTVRLGADARLRTGPLLLAAEYLWSRAETPTGFQPLQLDRQGYLVTAGVDVHPRHRLLVRLDHAASTPPGTDAASARSSDVVLGYNVALSQAASAQINATLPVSGPERESRGRIAALVQIAL